MSSCSDSDSIDNINEPPLVVPITHPFIMDDQLLEYDPESRRSKKIIDITLSDRLFVFIDSDEVDSQTDFEEREFNFHNRLPDFMAFTDETMERLFLFDMETRYLHNLYDFNANSNPNGREFICNLRNIPAFDTGSITTGEPVFKEKLAVYVETRPASGTCDDIDSLSHYEIFPADSVDENSGTYLVRQRITNLESETSTELNEFAVFVGEKRTINETTMYSSAPILQPNRDVYGHLGFDRQNGNALGFFIRENESKEANSLLWTLEGDNFDFQASENNSSPDAFQPFSAFYRAQESLIVSDHLILELGWNIVAIPLSAVFDDDFRSVREEALSTPLIARLNQDDDYTPVSFVSTNDDDVIYILDRNTVYQVSSATTVETINLNDTDISNFFLAAAGADELVGKVFNDEGLSVVTYDDFNTEITEEPKSNEEFFNLSRDAVLYLSQFDELNETWRSTIFNNIDTVDRTPEPNAVFGTLRDEQLYFGHDEEATDEVVVFASSNQAFPNPDRNVTQPRIFSLSSGSVIRADEDEVAFMNENLRPSGTNSLYTLSDNYGLADLEVETDAGTERVLFYYDPINRIGSPSLPSAIEALPQPSSGSSGISTITNCRNGTEIRNNNINNCYPN